MENYFDKYELYTEGDSIYAYKGKATLKNKLGIRDFAMWKEAEAELVTARLFELEVNPLPGLFDKKHLYDIHKYLFQDCYDFAGKTRKEDISKGNTKFCVCIYIDEQLAELFAKIKKRNVRAENKEEIVEFLGFIMAELNIIHPFREGNGRTIREFIKEYARRFGYAIDWNKTNKAELLDAMISSVFDNSELKAVLYDVMTELTDDEKIDIAAKRILEEHRKAFEELAK